ncbi:Por secretion system C-terminal sorting domain-containing protein [Dyadobacter sp. SG02]|uniref:FG-GAP-like repeat-containing protein n=1 Tax=Dyadobacter sp. SG02 TaxID=1855291 RepID=UPI0008C6E0FA|nr:FG-GAP-like repeat-containing protein [Dyadobacter sp. SG02]SEJ31407.1 Por secretion system C-terminal sorting domain-containing protein [Dyadobacter sp. SG02]
MRTKFTSFILFLTCLYKPSQLLAQQAWFKLDTLTSVSTGGVKMTNPWGGGLNASQFLKMHLNNDADEDLVVYDRTNSKVTTFLAGPDPVNAGKKTFIHAPYYETLFPQVDNWMVLADYNGDGLKDLFASTSLGIVVYQQVKTGNVWSWKKVRDVLYTKGFSGNINMQVSGTDIPAITDIDDDGDLDLLTFDFSGNYIELHQNLSVEKFGVRDSLGTQASPVFQRNGDCWGNFHKGDLEDFVVGVDCGVVTDPSKREASPAHILHAGNSILLHDLNGDGTKDLLAGHISNDHISFLPNSAKGIIANFTSFTNTYPTVDPVSLHIFPAGFYEDVDFDGVKDLLIAPSLPANDANMTDFKSSGWYYHNEGTSDKPVFKLVRKNFLQDQMIDVGENAVPSFFDIDGDGDLDMLMGTGGMPYAGGYKGSFWLLRNTGTATEPNFVFESQDYLELLPKLSIYNIKPQWADFNGDGVPDLGFAATATSNLKLEYRYIPNKGTNGAAAQLNLADAVSIALPAELQIGDSPYFYDADGDGDLDLLIGKSQGNIYYYTNTGTNKQYTFKLETDAFAGVDINFAGRFSQVAVADIDLDGKPDLATVDHTGTIRVFNNADWGKWTDRASTIVSVNGKAGNVNFGNYLSLAIADLNGDKKPDVAIGNNAGGVRLLTNILPVSVTGVEPGNAGEVKVFPNPSVDFFRIYSSKTGTFDVLTTGGVPMLKNRSIRANETQQISTAQWPAGLYLVELKAGNSRVVRKVVVGD